MPVVGLLGPENAPGVHAKLLVLIADAASNGLSPMSRPKGEAVVPLIDAASTSIG